MNFLHSYPPELASDRVVSKVEISSAAVSQIRTQLIALGLIEVTRDNYSETWVLTDAGREAVFRLVALQKPPPPKRRSRRPVVTEPGPSM